MATQSLDEQETTFTIEATDRSVVTVFSNDTVWQKRIEELGIEPYRMSDYGKWYHIDLDQFNFGIYRKRQLSDEKRAELAERMRGLAKVAVSGLIIT